MCMFCSLRVLCCVDDGFPELCGQVRTESIAVVILKVQVTQAAELRWAHIHSLTSGQPRELRQEKHSNPGSTFCTAW